MIACETYMCSVLVNGIWYVFVCRAQLSLEQEG